MIDGAVATRSGTNQLGPPTRFRVFSDQLEERRIDQPESGHEFCDGIKLFHDGENSHLAVTQTRALELKITTYQFDGSYISLSAGLSPDDFPKLRNGREVKAVMMLEATRPQTIFCRLVAVVGGEQKFLHQTLVAYRGLRTIPFDLDALGCPFEDLSNAWLDVIFPEPAMTEITIGRLDFRIGCASGN